MNLLESCTLCPRNCNVDRTKGERGYCGQTSELVVGRAALHPWEEPCISGREGSGTVFFSGCAMKCVFCQNRVLAHGNEGKAISVERLAEIFMELQAQKANNINLVTPDHYIPQIICAIDMAKTMGLKIPIVYNCSGYEKVETLKLLEGKIDVYLPDFKYKSEKLASRYSNCPDYFDYASAAISEMVRQVGEATFDDGGIIQKGVIVRHLVLPGCGEDSKEIIKHLYSTFGNTIYISIMNQFTPTRYCEGYPEINTKLSDEEYGDVVEYAISIGVENGFVQEGETALESFIPSFKGEGV